MKRSVMRGRDLESVCGQPVGRRGRMQRSVMRAAKAVLHRIPIPWAQGIKEVKCDARRTIRSARSVTRTARRINEVKCDARLSTSAKIASSFRRRGGHTK